MNDRSEIFNELKYILEDMLCLWEVSTLAHDMSLRRDLNFDSLDLVELLNAIEDHFDIELDLKEFAKCETIKDVVNYIHNTKAINGSEN